MNTPRAYTPEECRIRFQKHMLWLCKYWSEQRGQCNETELGRMEGLCHSIQAYLDGRTMDSPAIDLVLSPHDTDKAYYVGKGQNWFEKGMVINTDSLTENFFVVKDGK